MTKPAASAPEPTTEEAVEAAAPEGVRAQGDPKEGEEGEAPPVEAPPVEAPVEPPPIAADPLSETARTQFHSAFDALNRIEQSRGVAPEGDVSRSMWTVKDLASLLSDLYYLINNSAWEAALDGEGDAVPDQLRTALKTLADAFTKLSAQEAEQLVAKAGVSVGRALDYALARGGDAALTEEEQGAIQRALDGFVKRGFKLPAIEAQAPANADQGEEVKRLNDELETVKAANAAYEAKLGEIVERLNKLAAEPAPPKTAASGAARPVDKTEDAPGPDSARGAPNAEDIQRALDAMTPNERAAVLMKASLATPSQSLAHRVGVARAG